MAIYFWKPEQPDGYLSQWYPSKFIEDGVVYSNCEQYMMAKKAELFGDEQTMKKIMSTSNPRTIKALGREVKGYTDVKWNKHKAKIVYRGNLLKFSQNKELKERLLKTSGKLLAEASPYDKIWGIGLNPEQAKKVGVDGWKGQNILGKALMYVRGKLQE